MNKISLDKLYDSGFSERFDALYQLFNCKYKLIQNEVKVGKRRLQIVSIEDIDHLLDELIDLGPEHEDYRDERLPYWADIWPSSIAMAQFCQESPEMFWQKCAIELGCGVGLAGIVAADQGADVLITDYQDDALRLAEMNWLLNLEFSPEMLLMDWRHLNIDKKFDIILASDVVYEQRFFLPLFHLFHEILAENGRIILSEPNRLVAKSFFDKLPETGFQFEKSDVEIRFRGKKNDISVYVIQKQSK